MDSVTCGSCRERLPVSALTNSICPRCGQDVRGVQHAKRNVADRSYVPHHQKQADKQANLDEDATVMRRSPFAAPPLPPQMRQIASAPPPLPKCEPPPLPISRFDNTSTELVDAPAKPSALASFFIHVGPRSLRYLTYFGGWLGPPLFLLIPLLWHDTGYLCSFIMVGLPWYFFGHWPMRLLTPVVLAVCIQRLRCPACHETYPPHGVWHCGCGYHDYRQRNIFFFRCPSCHGRIGHFNCLRCDTTILI